MVEMVQVHALSWWNVRACMFSSMNSLTDMRNSSTQYGKLLKRTQTKATLATALPLLGSVCAHCKFPHTLKLNDFLETFHSEDLQINTNKVSSVKITFLLEPKINFLLRERNDTP